MQIKNYIFTINFLNTKIKIITELVIHVRNFNCTLFEKFMNTKTNEANNDYNTKAQHF